eukprot:66570-Rhodomonas_salina.1
MVREHSAARPRRPAAHAKPDLNTTTARADGLNCKTQIGRKCFRVGAILSMRGGDATRGQKAIIVVDDGE